MQPFIPPKVTTTCNILNITPIYSTSPLEYIVVYHQRCWLSMLTKGSPLRTVKWPPLCGLFGSQPCHDNNSGSCDNSSGSAGLKASRSGKHTNQYHLPHGYGYPPSQQPFPSAPQFDCNSPSNMTHNSVKPTTSAHHRFPRYTPPEQRYDLHHGGYGESQMFPPEQFPDQGPSSPGAPIVPPGLLRNNPVNWPTCSSSTPPPGAFSGATGGTAMILLMYWFQLPVGLQKINATPNSHSPPLPEIS